MAQIDQHKTDLEVLMLVAIELAEKECKYVKEVAEVPDVQTIFMTDRHANEDDHRSMVLFLRCQTWVCYIL